MLGNIHKDLPDIDFRNFLTNTRATHVVVAITYGFDCYFVFDRDKEKDNSESLQSYIAKALSDNRIYDHNSQENLKCQYHGDALPIQAPNNLQSAKQTLQVGKQHSIFYLCNSSNCAKLLEVYSELLDGTL